MHDDMMYDLIQDDGQGHGGPKVVKMADFKVPPLAKDFLPLRRSRLAVPYGPYFTVFVI